MDNSRRVERVSLPGSLRDDQPLVDELLGASGKVLAYPAHGMNSTDELIAYVTKAAALSGLTIDLASQAGVIENFARIEALARVVLDFPLPEEAEPAPKFEP